METNRKLENDLKCEICEKTFQSNEIVNVIIAKNPLHILNLWRNILRSSTKDKEIPNNEITNILHSIRIFLRYIEIKEI